MVAWIPNRCRHKDSQGPPTNEHFIVFKLVATDPHTPWTDYGLVMDAAKPNHLLQIKLDIQDLQRIELSPPEVWSLE